MKVIKVGSDFIVGTRGRYKEDALRELSVGERVVVFDLTDTKFIDSSALGMVKSVSDAFRENGGVLLLDGVSEDFQTLLELTHLDSYLFYRRTERSGEEEKSGPTLQLM